MIASITQTPDIFNFVLFQSICFRLNPFSLRPMALRYASRSIFQFDVIHVLEQNKVENIGHLRDTCDHFYPFNVCTYIIPVRYQCPLLGNPRTPLRRNPSHEAFA